jgi:hypothetical protein
MVEDLLWGGDSWKIEYLTNPGVLKWNPGEDARRGEEAVFVSSCFDPGRAM